MCGDTQESYRAYWNNDTWISEEEGQMVWTWIESEVNHPSTVLQGKVEGENITRKVSKTADG